MGRENLKRFGAVWTVVSLLILNHTTAKGRTLRAETPLARAQTKYSLEKAEPCSAFFGLLNRVEDLCWPGRLREALLLSHRLKPVP